MALGEAIQATVNGGSNIKPSTVKPTSAKSAEVKFTSTPSKSVSSMESKIEIIQNDTRGNTQVDRNDLRKALLNNNHDANLVDLILESKRKSEIYDKLGLSTSPKNNNSSSSAVETKTSTTSTTNNSNNSSYPMLLDLTGKRELMTVEAAHAVFDSLTSEACSVIKHIVFGSKSFDRATSAIAATKVRLMTSLVHADLADTIAGRETSIGLDVLKTFGESLMNASHLESLDLSYNALGTRGINVLQPIIQKHNLKTLRFFDTGLAAGACEEVLRCLELCRDTHGTLEMKELVFGESTSNSEGAIAISKILKLVEKKIEIFQMSAIRCGTSQYMKDPLLGGHSIAESLLNCYNLRHLNISDNSFRGAHTKLSKAIENMPNLQILNVKDIILTDEGVDSIFRALTLSRPPLEQLFIGHNNLSCNGLKRFRSLTTA